MSSTPLSTTSALAGAGLVAAASGISGAGAIDITAASDIDAAAAEQGTEQPGAGPEARIPQPERAPDHGFSAPASIVARPAPAALARVQTEDLRERAAEIITSIVANPAANDAPGVLSRAGMEPNGTVTFLKQRVSKMMGDSDSAAVMKSLGKLRSLMDKLSPEQVEKERSGIVPAIVRLVKRIPFADDVMATVKNRFVTVQGAVDEVIGGLSMQREQMQRDIVELDGFARSLDAKIGEIGQAVELAEVIVQEIQARETVEEAPAQLETLRELRRRMSMRIEDLEVVRQLMFQAQLSANQTMQSNDNLSDAIQRTVKTSEMTLPVMLSIQVALHRQQQAIKALEATRQYQADLVTANARVLKRGTEAVDRAAQSPTVDVARIKEAYATLLGAIDESHRRADAWEQQARQAVPALREMSNALESRIRQLGDAQRAKALLPDVNADPSVKGRIG